MKPFFETIRPLLFALPPETAHGLALAAVKGRWFPASPTLRHPELTVKEFGLTFPNPIGLAAGFDKNARVADVLFRHGFGFVEVGTVTPKPQVGNRLPRLFRLVEDEAVINRLGFNNDGLKKCVRRLSLRNKKAGIVGANIGKNKDSADVIDDYAQGLQAVYSVADYVTINISSPNTPGLRALQKRAALEQLLTALSATRDASAAVHGHRVPLLLKVAPDLDMQEKQDIADKAPECGIDGLIIANTTISRPTDLKNWNAAEQGGLSGKPLFDLSTQALIDFYKLTRGKIPLIGVGGIASGEDAYKKIRAGATLVQLYTALVYQGFGLIRRIEDGLLECLKRDGFAHISEAVGADAK
jgi:dihydroorotate dehydrogenase